MIRYLGIIAASGVIAASVSAETVTFEFTGTVSSNGLTAGPFAGAMVGDTAVMMFSFDDAAVATLEFPPFAPTVAFYDGAVGALSMTIGATAVTASMGDAASYRLGVQNVASGTVGSFDTFEIGQASLPPDAGFRLALTLVDTTSSALDSLSLPSTLDLNAFGQQVWRVLDASPSVFNELVITIDAFEVVVDDPPIEGDLDGDGQVDLFDLIQVVLDFGCSSPDPCTGDADGDGDVDIDDVNLVLSNLCEGVDCEDGDPCTNNFCVFGICVSFPDPGCS